MSYRRIHITGGQGSGKTTLAIQLGGTTGAPVHELDLVARVGGGDGPQRPIAERDALVAAIAETDDWITEGVHLGWTTPLLDRAEVIVWLDHLRPAEASGRMVRRFVSGAMREARTRRGRQRFLRVGDYVRHARHLGRALRQARAADDPAAFGSSLAPWSDRLIHCTSGPELEAFVASVAVSAGTPGGASAAVGQIPVGPAAGPAAHPAGEPAA